VCLSARIHRQVTQGSSKGNEFRTYHEGKQQQGRRKHTSSSSKTHSVCWPISDIANQHQAGSIARALYLSGLLARAANSMQTGATAPPPRTQCAVDTSTHPHSYDTLPHSYTEPGSSNCTCTPTAHQGAGRSAIETERPVPHAGGKKHPAF
jgi:hypothetical protein